MGWAECAGRCSRPSLLRNDLADRSSIENYQGNAPNLRVDRYRRFTNGGLEEQSTPVGRIEQQKCAWFRQKIATRHLPDNDILRKEGSLLPNPRLVSIDLHRNHTILFADIRSSAINLYALLAHEWGS